LKNKILLILTIIIIAGLMLWAMSAMIRNVASSALDPIRQADMDLRTQVASVLNPTPTILPDPVTIIQQVRPIARLETIQYSIQKVITAESRQDVLKELFGDRLLFVAHGVVIAGVDLSTFGENDVDIQDGILTITIPPAEIFVATLDNEKSYVYDRDTGLLRKSDPNLETLARQAAEAEILSGAIEDGILDQANINAQMFLSRLLNHIGFKDVIVIVNKP